MFEGAYMQASTRMLDDRNKRIPGEFNSYGARKLGLNLNTNTSRYKTEAKTDTFESSKKSKIVKGAAVAGGVIGALALLMKRKDISKLFKNLSEKTGGLTDKVKNLFKKSSEEATSTKFGDKIKNIFKKSGEETTKVSFLDKAKNALSSISDKFKKAPKA